MLPLGEVDPVARGIAIAGLATSVIATATAVVVARRDRATLHLYWQANETVPELQVTVVNSGRQPITLDRVYITDQRAPWWVRHWGLVRFVRPVIRRFREDDLIYDVVQIDPMNGDGSVLLTPGEKHIAHFEAMPIVALAGSGGQPWIAAVDARQRRTELQFDSALLDVLASSVKGR